MVLGPCCSSGRFADRAQSEGAVLGAVLTVLAELRGSVPVVGLIQPYAAVEVAWAVPGLVSDATVTRPATGLGLQPATNGG